MEVMEGSLTAELTWRSELLAIFLPLPVRANQSVTDIGELYRATYVSR